MTRALFVSDIHIRSQDDPNCALFLRFLDSLKAKQITHLFLVGDIFDFWIADREFLLSHYTTVIQKIRELTALGVKIHYFEGNHDLDLRPFWQHKLGAEVHSEAAFFTLGGLRFRVEHGDQMDPEDRGYLFLRWLLRTRFVIFLGRFLPEPLVRWIGNRASHASRDYTSKIKVASDEQVCRTIEAHAERVFAKARFDVLVCGHVHVVEDRRVSHASETYRYINLGTWLREPMVFEVLEHSAVLHSVENFINRQA